MDNALGLLAVKIKLTLQQGKDQCRCKRTIRWAIKRDDSTGSNLCERERENPSSWWEAHAGNFIWYNLMRNKRRVEKSRTEDCHTARTMPYLSYLSIEDTDYGCRLYTTIAEHEQSIVWRNFWNWQLKGKERVAGDENNFMHVAIEKGEMWAEEEEEEWYYFEPKIGGHSRGGDDQKRWTGEAVYSQIQITRTPKGNEK